jgi:tetratricopeptide (TPR) repeat protein
MYYKDRKATLPEIARALNADTVVEGSVLRDGGRARISVQLVDARRDQPIWSGFYDRDLRDLLTLQNELSREIAQQIRVQLTPRDEEALARSRPIEPEALQAYLRGRYFQNKRIGWATARAIPEFERAIRLQPDYALAHAALAEALIFAYPPGETMPRAKAWAERAVAVNPRLAASHTALGTVKLFWEWDWKGAEAEFRTALDLRPDDAEARGRYAHLLAAQGRFDQSIAQLQRALQIDPLSGDHNHALGRIYYFARQNDKAIAQFRKAIELDPNNYWAHFFLSIVYEREQHFDEAVQEWQRAAAIAGGKALDQVASVKEIYRGRGYEAVLRKRIEFEESKVRGPVISSSIAILYARLGEKEKAFEWLEESFRSHTRDLIYLKVEPQYDPLRSDPRFTRMLERVGLE